METELCEEKQIENYGNAFLGSIHLLEGGGVGRRNPHEQECKISWPSLYIWC